MFPSRLVLVLDEMERAGLVERKPSGVDRRTYALHITKRGNERLKDISSMAREHQEALCAALTASERETLAALLPELAESNSILRRVFTPVTGGIGQGPEGRV